MSHLAGLIGAPRSMLPASTHQTEGKWLSVYWREADDGDDEDGWFVALMSNEAGHDWELAEVGVDHADYLLFTVFRELTWDLARQGSPATSCDADMKLSRFAAQEALLERLNPDWSARIRTEHEGIIARDGLRG